MPIGSSRANTLTGRQPSSEERASAQQRKGDRREEHARSLGLPTSGERPAQCPPKLAARWGSEAPLLEGR